MNQAPSTPNNRQSDLPIFFDYASTTPCLPEAAETFATYSCNHYGNPSSTHRMGKDASDAIKQSRDFFADLFEVTPNQIIFTGSGTESDNLAVQGFAIQEWLKEKKPFRVITSAIEHPAVLKSVEALSDFGIDVQIAPVKGDGRVDESTLLDLVNGDTRLVSIQALNNIVGAKQDIESLASKIKERNPRTIVHTDCIQALGKMNLPTAKSKVDLVSLSAHKVEGPKGIGALVVLNKSLLDENRIRPISFGGGQECGLRGGTQGTGLIAAFHIAAKNAVQKQDRFLAHTKELREVFKKKLHNLGLLVDDPKLGQLGWNSPENGAPHIVSLSVPGLPSRPLANLIEEHGCLVATGSACSSGKSGPDHVLAAMGIPSIQAQSALRISFSLQTRNEDIDQLTKAIDESLKKIQSMLG